MRIAVVLYFLSLGGLRSEYHSLLRVCHNLAEFVGDPLAWRARLAKMVAPRAYFQMLGAWRELKKARAAASGRLAKLPGGIG
jgi:hypothetical protein